MDNFRPWALWRRVMYGSGFFATWALVGTLVYFTNYYEPANCFDGALNGDETGIDCGGSCVRVCAVDVIPPRKVWAESFAITPGQYNAVAYVENRNETIGTPELDYTFTFYSDGDVVAERSGTTVLPPNSSYPLFAGRVFPDSGREITDTELTLEPVETWQPASIDATQFRMVDRNLIDPDGRPRLEVRLENTALTPAQDIEVVATIFNDVGKPVTASETFIENFPAQSTQDIFFTWPQSIAKTVRSCSIPTDVVLGIDLSGSMNNDSTDPPQPLTDALQAASTFAANLRENDQIGVVTFATDATVAQTLTMQHDATASLIEQLVIDPVEETGFTNTAAALTAAATELNSERHADTSRRALVILTDGLPTAADGADDPEAAAIAAAQVLSEGGADVYAIGLGERVNQSFISALASEESFTYLAPTPDQLAGIYASITASLCEVGPTKIEVIAKTPTNFEPLR